MTRPTSALYVVLVCGGRDYSDRAPLWAELDRLLAERPEMVVIQGGQKRWDKVKRRWLGADKAAEEWAAEREVPCLRVPARWNALGRRAGPERNSRQLQIIGPPDVCVAAPGGDGTADMVSKARGAGVRVIEVAA